MAFLYELSEQMIQIAILSKSGGGYSTRRLLEEAQELGLYAEQIDHSLCSVRLTSKGSELYLREESISGEFQAVIPRIGSGITRHGAAIVKQFEIEGAYSTARSLGIIRARNKVRTIQLFAKEGLPIPDTVFSINGDSLVSQIEHLGGPPVIIKMQEGTHGTGVILAESISSAKSMADTLYRLGTPILLQRYIEEAKGEDIRIIVVDGEVVASMKRKGALGEFRANIHRGGIGDPVRLSSKEKAIALQATKLLGLGVGGVDLIRSKKGPLLIEVNASPGLQGIETATEINVARKIMEYASKGSGRKRR